MKKVLIFHGTCEKEEYYSFQFPSLSNSHWIPWLQKQLLVKDIEVHTPEVKDAYSPTYEKWLKELERYEVDAETVLVGHSCGGGFLTRWLSQNDTKVGRVILVAPWLNPDKLLPIDMFDFVIDPDLVSKTHNLKIFVADNDMETVRVSVEKIRDEVKGVEIREFQGMGHFTFNDMNKVDFPELLAECLK